MDYTINENKGQSKRTRTAYALYSVQVVVVLWTLLAHSHITFMHMCHMLAISGVPLLHLTLLGFVVALLLLWLLGADSACIGGCSSLGSLSGKGFCVGIRIGLGHC